MTEIRCLNSRSGTLYYNPTGCPRVVDKDGHRLFQHRVPRPSRITISKIHIPYDRTSSAKKAKAPTQPKKNINNKSTPNADKDAQPPQTGAAKTAGGGPALRFLRRRSSAFVQPVTATPSPVEGQANSEVEPSGESTSQEQPQSERRSSERSDNSQPTAQVEASPEPVTSNHTAETMTAQDFLRSNLRPSGRDSPRASADMRRNSNLAHKTSNGSLRGAGKNGVKEVVEEKALASAGGVSVSIDLAEPMLFLQGFDSHDTTSRSTAMLRGALHVKVAKSAKIKAVTLRFKGTATTKWPEGIPPKKVDFEETDSLMSHTWPFFNAQFPTAENGTGADRVRLVIGSELPGGEHGSPYLTSPPMSIMNVNSRDPKRLSLQNTYSRSYDKIDGLKNGPSVAAKGYRTFQPGDYFYNFELPLDSRLPESIDVDLGSVKYELEAVVERQGAFRGNLSGSKEVILIRAPSEGSLEQVEPIAISRTWEDQLHYDIVISGKSFPLNSKVPIAFKLTPLAKVQCHRIKVYVTENMEYFCNNKRVHRMEPTRKMLLFEKKADGTESSTYAGSSSRITAGGGVPFDQRDAAARGLGHTPQDPSNLLGHLEGGTNIGPTEMEFNVQLPGCQPQYNEKDKLQKLHFDTTYQNIQVHHWIKIVLRLSRPDTEDPSKRRHFEISIDSPFHILSCRANRENTALPAYSCPESANMLSCLADCGCPGAPKRRVSPPYLPTLRTIDIANPQNNSTGPADHVHRHASTGSTASTDSSTSTNSSSTQDELDRTTTNSGVARPQAAHISGGQRVQRPIHMLRAPSFNPPAFDAEEPPPLVTPPPQYDDIASPTDGHGLADYFSRLADAYDEDENSSEDERNSTRAGRVNVPLTPGTAVSRSMELRRNWLPVGN